MKNLKYLSVVAKLCLVTCMLSMFNVNAQNLPRWGSGPPQNDNTGRVLTYSVVSTATTTGTTDTINLTPRCWETIVNPSDSVLGTAIYIIKNPAQSYNGDRMEFYGIASKLNTPVIKFRNKYNTVWKFVDSTGFFNGKPGIAGSDSTLTLIKGKYYHVEFEYDGNYWYETRKATVGR